MASIERLMSAMSASALRSSPGRLASAAWLTRPRSPVQARSADCTKEADFLSQTRYQNPAVSIGPRSLEFSAGVIRHLPTPVDSPRRTFCDPRKELHARPNRPARFAAELTCTTVASPFPLTELVAWRKCIRGTARAMWDLERSGLASRGRTDEAMPNNGKSRSECVSGGRSPDKPQPEFAGSGCPKNLRRDRLRGARGSGIL